jgi:hypothetical protein
MRKFGSSKPELQQLCQKIKCDEQNPKFFDLGITIL